MTNEKLKFPDVTLRPKLICTAKHRGQQEVLIQLELDDGKNIGIIFPVEQALLLSRFLREEVRGLRGKNN